MSCLTRSLAWAALCLLNHFFSCSQLDSRQVAKLSVPKPILTVYFLKQAIFCRFNASAIEGEGVDPDEQMQSLQVHNNAIFRRDEFNIMNMAAKLVRSDWLSF
jgi:hypothetical protein